MFLDIFQRNFNNKLEEMSDFNRSLSVNVCAGVSDSDE